MDVTPIIEGLLGFFTSSCTVQQINPGQDGFGEEDGQWVDIEGLVDLPALDSAVKLSGPRLLNTPESTFASSGFLLAGYYPMIKPHQHRVVVDGVAYSVEDVTFSSRALTRLSVTRIA